MCTTGKTVEEDVEVVVVVVVEVVVVLVVVVVDVDVEVDVEAVLVVVVVAVLVGVVMTDDDCPTVITPTICIGCTWQKYRYTPADENVNINEPPACGAPELNTPSATLLLPLVTV